MLPMDCQIHRKGSGFGTPFGQRRKQSAGEESAFVTALSRTVLSETRRRDYA